MIDNQLSRNWLSQVADPPPLNTLGQIELTNRQQFPDFWRFTLRWPDAQAQLYNFVDDTGVAHKSPCVLIAAVAIPSNQLSSRLEGWASAEDSVFISMASGHEMYQAILQIRYEDASDFNLWGEPPDVMGPLRKAKKAFLDGTLVEQWRQFAADNNRSSIVFDTPNPQMHSQEAKANGFEPEYTQNGRTYWRLDA